MKKNRLVSLLLCAMMLLQTVAVYVQADETQPTETATATETTEATVNLDNIHVPAGEDASVVNGCRTLDGKMPLWGTSQLMPTSGAIMFYEVNSDTVVYSWMPDEAMEPASLSKRN